MIRDVEIQCYGCLKEDGSGAGWTTQRLLKYIYDWADLDGGEIYCGTQLKVFLANGSSLQFLISCVSFQRANKMKDNFSYLHQSYEENSRYAACFAMETTR